MRCGGAGADRHHGDHRGTPMMMPSMVRAERSLLIAQRPERDLHAAGEIFFM